MLGTTGMQPADEAKVEAAARHATIIKAGNMSLGVNLLTALTRKVAAALDADFDIEILEMHHRHKVDAPSGTALMLGRAAADGRGVNLDEVSVRVRDGTPASASAATSALPPCAAAAWSASTRCCSRPMARIIGELRHLASDRGICRPRCRQGRLVGPRQRPRLFSMLDDARHRGDC